MKTRQGDHGTPIGLFSPVEETYELYDGMFAMLRGIEKRFESPAQDLPVSEEKKSAAKKTAKKTQPAKAKKAAEKSDKPAKSAPKKKKAADKAE